jgi:RNA polymerase sigma-70 factor (ECF subfamily)
LDDRLGQALSTILAAKRAGDTSHASTREPFDIIKRHVVVFLRGHHRGLDASAVDDVTQNVLLKIWQGVETYDPDRSATTWISTIAARDAIDRWRRGGKNREVLTRREDGHEDGPSFGEVPDHREADPSLRLVTAEDVEGLRQAIGALPLVYKDVVERRFNGLTQRDIAEALCIPLGTVKSRFSKGLEKLQEVLSSRAAI